MFINESIVEDTALEWFGRMGSVVRHGPQMASGEATMERESGRSGVNRMQSFSELVLVGRLREAIQRLSAGISLRILDTLTGTLGPKQQNGQLRAATLDHKQEASA